MPSVEGLETTRARFAATLVRRLYRARVARCNGVWCQPNGRVVDHRRNAAPRRTARHDPHRNRHHGFQYTQCQINPHCKYQRRFANDPAPKSTSCSLSLTSMTSKLFSTHCSSGDLRATSHLRFARCSARCSCSGRTSVLRCLGERHRIIMILRWGPSCRIRKCSPW